MARSNATALAAGMAVTAALFTTALTLILVAAEDVPAKAAGGGEEGASALQFSATYPQSVVFSGAIDLLRADGDRWRSALAVDAEASAAELESAGVSVRPWTVELDWRLIAETPRYGSFVAEIREDMGGAHPNLRYETRLFRAGAEAPESLSDIISPASPAGELLTVAVCRRLAAAKMARVGEATVYSEPMLCSGDNANVRLADAAVAMAASSTPGVFGGLHVLFQPYSVGPYAEGAYTLTIGHTEFSEALPEGLRDLFGGEPLAYPDR